LFKIHALRFAERCGFSLKALLKPPVGIEAEGDRETLTNTAIRPNQ
jgi:hypothetical protein